MSRQLDGQAVKERETHASFSVSRKSRRLKNTEISHSYKNLVSSRGGEFRSQKKLEISGVSQASGQCRLLIFWCYFSIQIFQKMCSSQLFPVHSVLILFVITLSTTSSCQLMSYFGKQCLQKNVNGIRVSNFFICSCTHEVKHTAQQGLFVTERVGLSGTQLMTVRVPILYI